MKNITKFIVGAVAALAFVFAITASANAAYMQTTTLQVGSTGSQVMSLQQTLNMTACNAGTADGDFGPHTKAAVQCFQAANGLTADGVVGPMTGAALAAVNGSSMTMPAGCSSAMGYSTTTGAPCSGTPATTVFPAGCISSTGYSSTTGVSCATGTSTTGVSMTGPFSINSVTPVSGYLNTQVAVGATDKVIGDLRIVSGAGGSGNLTGVNVSIFNRGNGDYQFIKYASAVSVWLNGVKVGTLPATSFTQYNSQYSAFIPVSGAVLNPSTTNDLQLSVTALPVIDSANLTPTANTFAFEAQTLRYTDSTGSFSYTIPSSSQFDGGTITIPANGTETTGLQSSFTFANASSAEDITLTVSKDANDYNDHVVSGSTAATTTNVTLATLDLAAQGSAVTINRMPVTVNVTNTGSGLASTGAASVVNTLRLYNSAGVQVDSETVPAVANATSAVVTFQNLNMTIPAGSTQVLTVKGDVNAIDGSIVAVGSTVRIDVTSPDTAAIQAYDQNDNVLNNNTQNILIGSTTGSTVTFYVNGIQVSSTGAGTATAGNAGGTQSHSVLGFTIPFSVTAFGQQAYIPDTATAATTASSAHTIQFCVDNANGACQAVGTGVITYNGSDGLTPDGNGNYVIPAGQTKNFTLQITYTANGAASYRASLLNVNWSNTDFTSGGTTFTAGLNSNSFKTNYVSAQ
jgi:peptidoglycan hydrolase-like protein with peptidoglycan-binding domain